MNNTLTNFLLGLLCVGGLFVLCLLVVLGGKMLALSFKEKFFAKKVAPPPKPQTVKRRKKPSTIPKPVRSIEIDPDQVDKIYVKKIS